MPDWKKIKAEFIRGASYKTLSEKYGVSFSSIQKRGAKEKWTDLRKKSVRKRDEKIVESVARQEANRVDKIQTVADKLLAIIEEKMTDPEFLKDSKDMKALMSSLRDLKDIKGCKSELDREEQIARIEKLRRESQIEEKQNDIRVVISADLDDYSN